MISKKTHAIRDSIVATYRGRAVDVDQEAVEATILEFDTMLALCLSAEQETHPGNVYFIRCRVGDDCTSPIKIGYGMDVTGRLNNLQTGSPWPLMLLFSVPGSIGTEREFQRTTSMAPIRGEWFMPNDAFHMLLDAMRQRERNQVAA
jgi:hypothetical protein